MLKSQTVATWREAEDEVFDTLRELCEGRAPALVGLVSLDMRRLGYLADVARLLLEPADPEGLRKLAADIRSQLGPGPYPIAALMNCDEDKAPLPRGRDMIADRWGIARGVSVDRYLAERSGVATP